MAQRATSRPKFVSPRAFQRFGLWMVFLALLVLAGGLLIGFVRMAWSEHQINRSIERQEQQNAQQAAQNRRLQGAAEFAESDVAAEQAARERLGMAREGEMVLLPTVVAPASPTAAPTPVPRVAIQSNNRSSESNPVRWFRALFPEPDSEP